MNPDLKKRILSPSLIPVGAFVFIGALTFGFSRLLLAVPAEGSVVLGVLMAGCILFAAGAVSKGGALKSSQRTALIVFSLLVIGGGVAAGTSLHTREVEGGPAPIGATLTARGTAFDKLQFKLPAETRIAIEFVNADPGIPHNVAIYGDPAFTQQLLIGPVFAGVRTGVETLEDGLPQGVYFFRCDVHATVPAMIGNLIVGNPPNPPPSPSATGPGTASPSPSPSPGAPASPSPSPSPS